MADVTLLIEPIHSPSLSGLIKRMGYCFIYHASRFVYLSRAYFNGFLKALSPLSHDKYRSKAVGITEYIG